MPPRTPAADVRRNSVGFKVTDDELVALLPFFETFNPTNVTTALRWLILENPEVRAIIDTRIRGATTGS